MSNIIDDPTKNFSLSPNDALGLNIPEVVFYQLLGFTFKNISETIGHTENIVDQLFARLRAETRQTIKTWFVNHPNVSLSLNWPRDDVGLPFIAIITESEEEDSDLTLLGDYAGVHTLGSSSENQQTRTNLKLGLSNTTNIIIAADDPNLVLYLGAVVRFVFLKNKDDLTRLYDIHSLTVSQADLKWDERFLPTFAYMRMVTLRYKTFFDINLTEKVSMITSLETLVSTFNDGLEVTVTTPYDQ